MTRAILPYIKWTQAVLFLLKNPAAEGKVFDIGDALIELGSCQNFLAHLNSNPRAAEIIQRRELIPQCSLQDLAKLPEGTFGRIYADELLSKNLDPDYFRPPANITDQTFPFLRLRQAHDVWHVVTGFDTTVLGEIGVHAFMLGQFSYPLSAHLVALSLIGTTFRNPEQLGEFMAVIVRGWKMGREAQPLFEQKWEDHWTTPLKDLRRELNVVC